MYDMYEEEIVKVQEWRYRAVQLVVLSRPEALEVVERLMGRSRRAVRPTRDIPFLRDSTCDPDLECTLGSGRQLGALWDCSYIVLVRLRIDHGINF